MYGFRVLPTPTTAVMRPTRMMKHAPSFVSHANLPLAVRSRMHAGNSHPMATAAIAPVIVCATQKRLYGFSRAGSCTIHNLSTRQPATAPRLCPDYTYPLPTGHLPKCAGMTRHGSPGHPVGVCCALYTLSIMGKHARGTAQETHHDRPDVGHSHSNTIGYNNDGLP